LRLEPRVHGRHARERKIERALGQGPEIDVTSGKRQRPGIFQLFRSPDFRKAIGVRTGGGAMARDRGVHVEQRAIGIEHENRHDGLLGRGRARLGVDRARRITGHWFGSLAHARTIAGSIVPEDGVGLPPMRQGAGSVSRLVIERPRMS
jgi:hypothetical protein